MLNAIHIEKATTRNECNTNIVSQLVLEAPYKNKPSEISHILVNMRKYISKFKYLRPEYWVNIKLDKEVAN